MNKLTNLITLAALFSLSQLSWSGPIEDVQALLNREDYELALSLAERHLKEDRKNEQLLLQKGFALIKMEEYDKAITHYKKLIRRFKDNPEPSNNLGVIYRLQGNYNDSVKQLKRTVQKFPTYARAWENLGDTYVRMAEREYERGLEQVPGNDLLTTKRDISRNFHAIALKNSQAAKQPAAAARQSAVNSESDVDRSLEDQVVATLQSWVKAWSSRDPDRFLSHYSMEYVPGNGLPLGEWVQQVRLDLEQSTFIQVNLDNIQITRISPGLVSVQFRQRYQSDRLQTDTEKSMTMGNFGGEWLIVSETAPGS